MVGQKPSALYQVRIIVDANIVFSGVLNSKGLIGDLLINSNNHFQFIAPYFLKAEIERLHPRLSKISGLAIEQVKVAESHVCCNIDFIEEEQIAVSCWTFAAALTGDVDPNDTPYIAFATHFKCKIWSGDKALMNGLAKKDWIDFITTQQLFEVREERRKQGLF